MAAIIAFQPVQSEPHQHLEGRFGVSQSACVIRKPQAANMVDAILQRYRAAFAGLPREVWVLALVMFVNRSGAMVLAFLTLYLTSQIGMSEAAAGGMVSLYGLGMVAGAYIGGRLADCFGAVRLQTVGMALACPAYLLIPLWQSPLAIAVNVFVLSANNEAMRPANATAIAKLTPQAERTRAFALQRLAANFGFSFGPAIGGYLAHYDYTLLFLVDGFTTLAGAAILFVSFRMRRLPGEVPHENAAPRALSPRFDYQFLMFLGLVLVTSLVFFQFLATYTLYLRDHYGMGEQYIGVMFAVNTLVIVAFEMVLIDYARTWPLARTIGWGSFFVCIGFGILPFGTSLAFAVFAMLVMTLGEMLSLPLMSGYVANRAPPGSEGHYMSYNAVTVSVAAVLGPLIGSSFYAINRDVVWLVSLAIGFLVLGGFYLLPLEEHEPIAATDVGQQAVAAEQE